MTNIASHCIDPKDLDHIREKHSGCIFGEIYFGNQRYPVNNSFPKLSVCLPPLLGSEFVEVWTSDSPLNYGDFNNIRYAYNDSYIFGCVSNNLDTLRDLETVVQHSYETAFSLLDQFNFKHLVRMWNIIPEINNPYDGLENYQRFCIARYNAFKNWRSNLMHKLPAASAVGTKIHEFSMYFFAARNDVCYVENPRQVSAYRYPKAYGPCSPSFSRASLLEHSNNKTMYISGTASIVGHQSIHVDNIELQTDETLKNIFSLLENTNKHQINNKSLQNIKVYVRRENDAERIRQKLSDKLYNSENIKYLRADICRQELLLEVEGIACKYSN